jgi:glycine oxidase
MTNHPDVAILGGGVIGLTTAHYLARHGVRVEVLDQGDLGRESSWAGAGIISPAPEPHLARTPLERLHALSVRRLAPLAEELRASLGIDTGYIRCGGLQLLEPDEEDTTLRHWRQIDIAFEEMEGRKLHHFETALSPRLGRVYFLPETAQVRNPRYVKALMASCGTQGVVMRPGCPVFGFERQGSRITAVRTGSGALHAGCFLIACGAWTDTLLEPLGVKLGVHPVRGQIALLHAGNRLITRIIEQGKRYLVPRSDGRVLVGSTEEDAGFDKRTTAAAVEELLRFAFDLVPGLASAHVERCWAGLRPGSRDGLPFLGAVPGVENLFVAAGHFRAGIMLSAGTGVVMAELLRGQAPSVPLEAFRLDR